MSGIFASFAAKFDTLVFQVKKWGIVTAAIYGCISTRSLPSFGQRYYPLAIKNSKLSNHLFLLKSDEKQERKDTLNPLQERLFRLIHCQIANVRPN
jgi:hypothetical protein